MNGCNSNSHPTGFLLKPSYTPKGISKSGLST